MHESFSILLARPEPVAAAGSSSGERGLPACGFRLLAETDFLLLLALDEFTIPVRSKTRRGELGLWRLAKTDSRIEQQRTRLASWSRRPRRTHFVQSNSDFARAAQTNFSSSIPSRLRYRVGRLYGASSHQMSITRTSAGNSPSPLTAASSPPDSKLDR